MVGKTTSQFKTQRKQDKQHNVAVRYSQQPHTHAEDEGNYVGREAGAGGGVGGKGVRSQGKDKKRKRNEGSKD